MLPAWRCSFSIFARRGLITASGSQFFMNDDVNKVHYFAPNGKPSKLSREDYDYCRSRLFKALVGDWELVETCVIDLDENDEPTAEVIAVVRKIDSLDLELAQLETAVTSGDNGVKKIGSRISEIEHQIDVLYLSIHSVRPSVSESNDITYNKDKDGGSDRPKSSGARNDVFTRTSEYVQRSNTRFNDELQRQINGDFDNERHVYNLGYPGPILHSIGIPNLPILVTSSKLNEKAYSENHKYALSEIKDLVAHLNTPIAIFSYGDGTRAQNIIIGIKHNDKHFLIGLSLNSHVNGVALEINSIRTIFPKDNYEWLRWIQEGKTRYMDKEIIKDLVAQQRINLADVDHLDLDLIAKIIDNFENNKINEDFFIIDNWQFYGVFLDDRSKSIIDDRFAQMIPDGWKKYADHITVLYNDYSDERIAQGRVLSDMLGKDYPLKIVAVGRTETAIAFKVEGVDRVNGTAHLTLAVSPSGRPVDSNKITEWEAIEPVAINGKLGLSYKGKKYFEILKDNDILDYQITSQSYMDNNTNKQTEVINDVLENKPAIEALPQLLQSFHLLSKPAMEGAIRRIDSLLALLDKAEENEDVFAIAVEAWKEKVLGNISLDKMTKENLIEQLTMIRDVVKKTIVDASYESQQEVYASSKEFHEKYDYAIVSDGYAYATQLAYLKTVDVDEQLIKDILSGNVQETLSRQIESHDIGSDLFRMKRSDIRERDILRTAMNVGSPQILGLAEPPSAQNGYVGSAFQFDSVYVLNEPLSLGGARGDVIKATAIAFKEYKDCTNVFVIVNDKAVLFHSYSLDKQLEILSAISRSLDNDRTKVNIYIPDDLPKIIEGNHLVYQMNAVSALEKEWSSLIRKTMVGNNSIDISILPCPPFNTKFNRYLGLQMLFLYLERVANPRLSPCWAGKVDLAKDGYYSGEAHEYSTVCLSRNGVVQLRPLVNYTPDCMEEMTTLENWDSHFRSQLNAAEKESFYNEAMCRFNNDFELTPFDASLASLYFAVRIGYDCGPITVNEEAVKDLLVDDLSIEEISSRREKSESPSLYASMLSVCSRCMQVELEMQLGLRIQTHIPEMKEAVTVQAVEELESLNEW